MGRLLEVSGSREAAVPGKPFVIYIQDAHGNFEGQKHIIELIRFFDRGLGGTPHGTTFFVEGLVGSLDPNMLKVSQDPEENEKNLWSRLEKGEISAASYLSTVEPEKYHFLPLEDRKLYADNLRAFQDALVQNQDALKHLKRERIAIESSISRILSPEALRLYQSSALRKKRSDLIPAHLVELHKNFIELFRKETSLAETPVASKFREYFPSLEKVLSAEASSQAGRPDPQKLSGLESEDFFGELEHLEHLLLRLLARSSDEVHLTELLEKLDRLESFFSLELTRQDWSLLTKNWKEYSSQELVGKEDPVLDEALIRSRHFYEGAEDRDAVFQDRITRYLKDNQDTLVFLVTGGFHTEPLERFLTRNNVSYAILSPRLGELQKGKDIYLSQMKGIQVATIPVPLANDNLSPLKTVRAASLGGPVERSKPEVTSPDWIPEIGMRARDFDAFGKHLELFKKRIIEKLPGVFTPTQMSWLDDALKLGEQAKKKLGHKELDSGIIQWGNTLLEFHRFIENPKVQATLDKIKKESGSDKEKRILMRTLGNAVSEETKINDLIASHLTQYELQGMNVKVKGKTDRGKAVAIGRLVIIDDVNSLEGTQKLSNLHPDDIVVLADFPTRAISVKCAGIIVSREVGETAHAVALAREWEVPLFELPMANVFLKKLEGRQVKITISEDNRISFGLASPHEERSGKYLITRERVVLADTGTFTFDKNGNLYSKGQIVSGEPSAVHLRMMRNMAEGIAYRESDDGSLWRTDVWDLPRTDPRRGPEAKPGEWLRGLLFHPENYQVDLEGRVYQDGKPVTQPKEPDRVIRKGEWYVGIFQQDAVLERETNKKNIFYPPPYTKGSLTIPLEETGINLASAVGVKAAILGEVGSSGIVEAPEKGFTASFSAYEALLTANGLKDRIAKKAAEITDYRDVITLDRVTGEIRDMILKAEIPEKVSKEVLENVRKYFGNSPIIIRSSTNLEDLPQEAAPGVYDSIVVPEPTDEAILSALKNVWASIWNPKAAALRHNLQIPHDQVYPAALFLKLIDGSYGGVIYLVSTGGDMNRMVVEVAHGGPGNIVDNTTSKPARFEVLLPGGEIQTVRPNSDISEYTVFKNGRPEIQEVPPGMRNRPVIMDETIKRKIAEIFLQIREILKREGIDGEFIVDRDGKIHVLQARYMSNFPVNDWQKAQLQLYFGPMYSQLLDSTAAGEAAIREMNRARNEGDITGLLEIARKNRRLAPFALEAIERRWSFSQDPSERDKIISLIAPHFEKGGFLYELYGGPFFWMLPAMTNALEKFIIYLKRANRLPEAMREKQREILSENLAEKSVGHFTSDHFIRDLMELIDQVKYDADGKMKNLNAQDEALLSRLEENLKSQLLRWSPEKLLTASEREPGDDPERLLWLLGQVRRLNSPKKDVRLSEMFLAQNNEYVRKRVLRDIENEQVLRKEEEGFQLKERDEMRNIRSIKNEIAETVEKLIPLGEEANLTKIALYEFLEHLEIHYPQYGNDRQIAELKAEDLLRAPEHIRNYLKGNVLPQNGTLQDLKDLYLSDTQRTKEVFQTFGISAEIIQLLGLEKELAEAESSRLRYSHATGEIARFIDSREEAQSHSLNIFEFAQETRNGLLGLVGNLEEIKGMAVYPEFQKDAQFADAYRRFEAAQVDALDALSNITDTRSPKAFRKPLDTMLRDPKPALKTFLDISDYLNYAQDSSSKIVELMLASKEMVDSISRLAAERKGSLPDEVKGYVERLPGNLQQLHKLLELSWEQMTFSFFLKGSIYPLPEEAKLAGGASILDVASELKDVQFLFQSFSSYKDKVRITVESQGDLPILKQLPPEYAARPMYLNLALLGLVANAIEAVTKTEKADGSIELKAERYRDAKGTEGILIHIRDNGVGMSPDDLKRIYDRDYSTKPTFGEVEMDLLTNRKKSPFGSGLSIIKRQVEKELGGWLRHESTIGVGTEAQVFVPIQGQSLGAEDEGRIQDIVRERFGIRDDVFSADFASQLMARVAREKAALLAEPALEPELVVTEGLVSLPEELEGLEKLLAPNRYLAVIDRDLSTEELSLAVLKRYHIRELPKQLRVQGFEKRSIEGRELAEIPASFGVDFGERISFAVPEADRPLLRLAGRAFYPQHVLYSENAPKDLVLPLAFHLAGGQGQLGADYRDYVRLENNVFMILSLDELVRRILLESHADKLLSAAA